MIFSNSILRYFLSKQSHWARWLFFHLPPKLRDVLKSKIKSTDHVHEIRPLKKAILFPLDASWTEVIFAPFHDPEISPSLPVTLKPVTALDCQINFSWCWTVLNWMRCEKSKEALILQVTVGVDVQRYDRLLLCLAMPKETSVRIKIKQNDQWRLIDSSYRGAGKRMELSLPIEQGMLDEINLHFISDTPLRQVVQLSWFGLQNSQLVRQLTSQTHEYNMDWPGLIKPMRDWGPVRFEIGILFSETDLQQLRRKKNRVGWDKHFQLLEKKAQSYLKRSPESDLSDYLPFKRHPLSESPRIWENPLLL